MNIFCTASVVPVILFSVCASTSANSQGRAAAIGGLPPGVANAVRGLPPGLANAARGLPPGLANPTAPGLSGGALRGLGSGNGLVVSVPSVVSPTPGVITSPAAGAPSAPTGIPPATRAVGVSAPVAASTTGSVEAGTGAATSYPAAGASGSGGSIPPLPRSLLPLQLGERTVSVDLPAVGRVIAAADEVQALARGVRPRSGAPDNAIANCRDAIAAAALPYGAIRVDGAAAGPMRKHQRGYSLPITMNVFYARLGGLQARHAMINCFLSPAGQVLAYGVPSVPTISRAGR